MYKKEEESGMKKSEKKCIVRVYEKSSDRVSKREREGGSEREIKKER